MAHIVIVEDNEDIAMLYQRMFLGHQANIVSSAPAAIEYLQTHIPNLLILDLHLSGSLGITVLENIRGREELNTLPVVVISADDLMKEAVQKLGIAAFMTKPIDIDQVMTTVEKLLLKTASPATI